MPQFSIVPACRHPLTVPSSWTMDTPIKPTTRDLDLRTKRRILSNGFVLRNYCVLSLYFMTYSLYNTYV